MSLASLFSRPSLVGALGALLLAVPTVASAAPADGYRGHGHSGPRWEDDGRWHHRRHHHHRPRRWRAPPPPPPCHAPEPAYPSDTYYEQAPYPYQYEAPPQQYDYQYQAPYQRPDYSEQVPETRTWGRGLGRGH